jgi:hypothetical protein
VCLDVLAHRLGVLGVDHEHAHFQIYGASFCHLEQGKKKEKKARN